MIGIVVSRADGASEHVGEHLRSLRDWSQETDDRRPDAEGGGTVYRSGPFELREFEDIHLGLDGVAEAFDDPALVAFASRHSGETGPLLTAHFTGNVGPAEFGGADHELATAAPAALDRVVEAFDAHAPDGYDVGIECTHHGPSTVGAPSLFVELGSGEAQWDDPAGAEAVARAILALATLDEPAGGRGAGEGDGTEGETPASGDGTAGGTADRGDRTLVGFGGGHYAPRFERVLRETGWLVGHVAADWALGELGDPAEHPDVVRQVFERSGAEHALLDGNHPDLAATVADLGYRVVSETWVREVDSVAGPVVERAEATLGPVDDGTRFGTPARTGDGAAAAGGSDPAALSMVPLPDDLLDAALGVDADRTREAVDETLVAYETRDGGTRPGGSALVASSDDRVVLVDRLVDLLATQYDAVERADGQVLARETAFDPQLAREQDVPEGPAFGRLADGEPVEVDGETVEPDDVTTERTERFDLPD